MQRQFRVSERSGLTTLVNLAITTSGVQQGDMRRAAHDAGCAYEMVRVALVPRDLECVLPWDCIPLTLPAYPLPNETQQYCEACQWRFLSALRTRYCTRRCADLALVRRYRVVDADLPIASAWGFA